MGDGGKILKFKYENVSRIKCDSSIRDVTSAAS